MIGSLRGLEEASFLGESSIIPGIFWLEEGRLVDSAKNVLDLLRLSRSNTELKQCMKSSK